MAEADEAPEAPAPEAHAVYERRAIIGRIALTLRTAVAQVVILGGTIVLARELRPEEFGTFAMAQFALTVLTLVGDAGLGGALVQKTTTPTQRELSSVFFAQMALALCVLVLAALVGEALPLVFTDMPAGTPWIVEALALNFLLTSARVVPTLLMERELHFVRVSILDTVNSVLFYLVAAILSLRGAGVWALVLGVLAQGAGGLVTALLLRPWRPSLELDREVLRGLLGFGVPFQARGAIALLTRSSIPVVAGSMLGTHAVGILNWALETAFFPLTFIDIITRVSFPLYSRLQGSPEAFAAELDRSLRLGATITFFLSGMFLGLAPQLTEIIYSAQWLEAVPMLRTYAVAVTFGMLVYLFAPAFDALGKPRLVMLQLLAGGVAAWIATAIGTHLAGALGFAIGYTIALLVGAIVVIVLVRSTLPPAHLLSPFAVPILGSCVVAALGHFVLGPRTNGPITLALSVVAEIAVFLAVVVVLDRRTANVLWASLPRRARAVPT